MGFSRQEPWRRKWQPTPVFLPGEFRGQRGLAKARRLGRLRAALSTQQPGGGGAQHQGCSGCRRTAHPSWWSRLRNAEIRRGRNEGAPERLWGRGARAGNPKALAEDSLRCRSRRKDSNDSPRPSVWCVCATPSVISAARARKDGQIPCQIHPVGLCSRKAVVQKWKQGG